MTPQPGDTITFYLKAGSIEDARAIAEKMLAAGFVVDNCLCVAVGSDVYQLRAVYLPE